MRLWRISKTAFASDTTGEGARLYGGRWTSAGLAAIYTAEHPALAGFEKLVHTGISIVKAPLDHELVAFAIPDDASVTEVPHVPEMPMDVGDQWLRAGTTLLLRVPSVVVPESWNYVINPRHAEFASVPLHSHGLFVYDRRIR